MRKRIVPIILALMVLVVFISVKDVEAARYTKTNGYYQTRLSKKAAPLRDPADGSVYGYLKYIKKAAIKNNRLVTYGNYDYAKNEYNLLSYMGTKIIKAKKRIFILHKKCKFYTGGGGSPSSLSDLRVKKISKAKAKKYIKKYNGKDVIIRVKKNKVVEIIFASLCYY